MGKIAGAVERSGAELWINHNQAQSDAMPKASAYIE
jgi:hypothetical protein